MVHVYLMAVTACMVLAVLAVFRKCYVISGPNDAVVRTGLGGLHICVSSGVFVVPFFHRYTRFSLEATQVEVSIPQQDPDSDSTLCSLRLTVAPDMTIEGLAQYAARMLEVDDLTSRNMIVDCVESDLRQVLDETSENPFVWDSQTEEKLTMVAYQRLEDLGINVITVRMMS